MFQKIEFIDLTKYPYKTKYYLVFDDFYVIYNGLNYKLTNNKKSASIFSNDDDFNAARKYIQKKLDTNQTLDIVS